MKLHKSHFLFAKIAHQLGYISTEKWNELIASPGNIACSERLRMLISSTQWNKVRLIYLEKIITQMLVRYEYITSEEYDQIMDIEIQNAQKNEKIWEPLILSHGIITADMEHCFLKGFSKKGGDVPGLVDENLLAAKNSSIAKEEYDSSFLRIGDYIVEKLLAENTTSKTYKAHHEKLGKKFIIKVFQFPFHGDLGSSIRLFSQEMKIITKLRHKNIIPVHDIGVFENKHYIAMPFIDGVSLRQNLSEQKFTLHQSLAIVLRIAEALGITHRHNIVHKSLAPQNIIIDDTGTPYIKGFGLKNLLQKLLPQEISSLEIYYSPEHLKQKPLTPESDIYSLGIILYEILLGKRVHHSKSKVLQKYYTFNKKLQWHRLQIPKEVQQICERATCKNPVHRYHNGTELAKDLRCYLNREPLISKQLPFKVRLAAQIRHNIMYFLIFLLVLFSYSAKESYTYYEGKNVAVSVIEKLKRDTDELNKTQLISIKTIKNFHILINEYQLLLASKHNKILYQNYIYALDSFFQYALETDIELAGYVLNILKTEADFYSNPNINKLQQRFLEKKGI